MTVQPRRMVFSDPDALNLSVVPFSQNTVRLGDKWSTVQPGDVIEFVNLDNQKFGEGVVEKVVMHNFVDAMASFALDNFINVNAGVNDLAAAMANLITDMRRVYKDNSIGLNTLFTAVYFKSTMPSSAPGVIGE